MGLYIVIISSIIISILIFFIFHWNLKIELSMIKFAQKSQSNSVFTDNISSTTSYIEIEITDCTYFPVHFAKPMSQKIRFKDNSVVKYDYTLQQGIWVPLVYLDTHCYESDYSWQQNHKLHV